MFRCPSCAADLPTPSRFCPSCGAPFATPAEAETIPLPSDAPASSDSVDEGRFPVGTLLAGRYRILGRLGRGGMGEVYRANDLTLGQPVALKFLPEAVASDPRVLARFHTEVRLARQVSHPNVCRVYDIGEHQGAAYITMEFVDGEDLASLLRRIGRLPADKAIEIARKLCAGLAAAHDKGVLHRDLKPANVMIDGRGQVLITDFGLAGIAGQIPGGEIRSGTPAYMAPEQLAGKEVSVRSDIYALGLILYEMFTGKHAFQDGRRDSAPVSITTLVKEVDPAVERVIERCLQEDPAARPRSALAVAAALPGGDPLAAALAAGETPSPEMVAAAAETGRLSVGAILIALALVLVGLPIAIWLAGMNNILQQMPFEKSPEVLAHRAREIAQGFGYTARPADSLYEFHLSYDYKRWAEQNAKVAEVRDHLAKGRPWPVLFLYRQSPRSLWPYDASGNVGAAYDPPMDVSGMVREYLDTQGRLVEFDAVPPEREEPGPGTVQPPDAAPLFAAAGLELAGFTPAEPKWAPDYAFDARAAWTGVFPEAPKIPLRVEAAWWRGKPVSFKLIEPWHVASRMEEFGPETGTRIGNYIVLSLIVAVLAAAAFLAWRNARMGRGDRHGARVLFVFVVCCTLLSWLCTAKHFADRETVLELRQIVEAIGRAFLWGACYAVCYLALEPYVRRRWPQSLISWSRLLAGGFRDPMVGGHALIGLALGLGLASLTALRDLGLAHYSGLPRSGQDFGTLLGARHLAGALLSSFTSPLIALFLFFLFFLLRVLLRREWIAALGVITLLGLPGALQSGHPAVWAPFEVFWSAAWMLVVIRFGLLALVIGLFAEPLLNGFCVTTDFSAWYAGNTYFVIGVVLIFTAYACHTALAGRKILKEDLFD